MVKSKSEITNLIGSRFGMSNHIVDMIIDTFIEEITTEVANGNKVNIKDFGVFEPVKRAERVGRNLHTMEQVIVPAHIEPRFKPFKCFKNNVYKEVN